MATILIVISELTHRVRDFFSFFFSFFSFFFKRKLSDFASLFKEKRKGKPGSKVINILGVDPGNWRNEQRQKMMPAYLQLDHTAPSDIILNPDGAVRAGTLPALIERLTMHSGSGKFFELP